MFTLQFLPPPLESRHLDSLTKTRVWSFISSWARPWLPIGIQANIHLGGQTKFFPNGENKLYVMRPRPGEEKKIMNYCSAYFFEGGRVVPDERLLCYPTQNISRVDGYLFRSVTQLNHLKKCVVFCPNKCRNCPNFDTPPPIPYAYVDYLNQHSYLVAQSNIKFKLCDQWKCGYPAQKVWMNNRVYGPSKCYVMQWVVVEGVKYPEKTCCEGVLFKVISVTRGRVQFSVKKNYVTLEWPLRTFELFLARL